MPIGVTYEDALEERKRRHAGNTLIEHVPVRRSQARGLGAVAYVQIDVDSK